MRASTPLWSVRVSTTKVERCASACKQHQMSANLSRVKAGCHPSSIQRGQRGIDLGRWCPPCEVVKVDTPLCVS
eukprot:1524859-Amphidinium_carterae.1